MVLRKPPPIEINIEDSDDECGQHQAIVAIQAPDLEIVPHVAPSKYLGLTSEALIRLLEAKDAKLDTLRHNCKRWQQKSRRLGKRVGAPLETQLAKRAKGSNSEFGSAVETLTINRRGESGHFFPTRTFGHMTLCNPCIQRVMIAK